jgi:DNA-binding NarL/FixJ family response regulator
MGSARVASSLIRSREGRNAESELLGDVLGELIHQWLEEGQLERLKCLELLLVLGWRNKDVATHMGITEQTVANHKSFVLRKLKTAASESPLGQLELADFGLEDPDND